MNACRKGKAGEREAAHYINGLFPGLDMRRGAQHAGNADAPDIKGFPDVHFEVKRAEKLNIHAAMAQAKRDSEGKAVPVVLHRRNRGQWLVTLEGDNLVSFSKAVILANEAGMASNAGQEAGRAAERAESKLGAKCDNVAEWQRKEYGKAYREKIEMNFLREMDKLDTDKQTMPTDKVGEQEKMP